MVGTSINDTKAFFILYLNILRTAVKLEIIIHSFAAKFIMYHLVFKQSNT